MDKTLEYVIKKFNLNTGLDSPIYLPSTRNDLAQLFHELGYKIGAEVGVFNGAYSKILCEAIPDLKLYCIDSWNVYEDLPETKDEKYYKHYISRIERGYDSAKSLLSEYSCEFIKKYSMEAVKDFARDSLDFVYIDANHLFDYVMEDIIEWSKIVKPGGIVSGHDYRCFKHKEVGFHISSAVNTYTSVHNIKPLFVLDKDKSSSWFFVKDFSNIGQDW